MRKQWSWGVALGLSLGLTSLLACGVEGPGSSGSKLQSGVHALQQRRTKADATPASSAGQAGVKQRLASRTKSKRRSLSLSPEQYRMIERWQGQDLPLFRVFVVKRDKGELVKGFLVEVSRTGDFVPLTKYMASREPQALAHLGDKPSEEAAFRALVVANHPLLNRWQSEMLRGKGNFTEYAKARVPELYKLYLQEYQAPARSMTLYEYTSSVFPKQAEGLIRKLFPTRPYPPKTSGPRGPCECQIIHSFNNNPSHYVQPAIFDEWSPSKHRKWWRERHFAAHYAEAYVLGLGAYHSVSRPTLQQKNKSSINLQILCADSTTTGSCSGCTAEMNIYALYGSQLNVHNWQWGFFGGKSTASAMDDVKMNISLYNGSLQAFHKGLALAQTHQEEFNASKVTDLVDSIKNLYAQIKKDKNDNLVNAADLGKYAEIASKLIKDGKSLITITGKNGTSSETMHLEYNTNAQSTAPSHIIQQGRSYAVSLETDGSIVYEGTNYHKTNNTYYGSSAGLAIAISNIQCTSQVTVVPRAKACWVRSDTYRSPHYGTTTVKDNIDQFMKFNLGLQSVNTSANEGCYQ